MDNDLAVPSAALPGDFPKDPAGRMIVATSRKLGASLITADAKIRDYPPHVQTVW